MKKKSTFQKITMVVI
ncbi:DUF4044 domain-containing protein [Lactiplantibacillus plantarum]|nr:DUF4044 domain-containing protein [Lactiplantibacillus plantarum]